MIREIKIKILMPQIFKKIGKYNNANRVNPLKKFEVE